MAVSAAAGPTALASTLESKPGPGEPIRRCRHGRRSARRQQVHAVSAAVATGTISLTLATNAADAGANRIGAAAVVTAQSARASSSSGAAAPGAACSVTRLARARAG